MAEIRFPVWPDRVIRVDADTFDGQDLREYSFHRADLRGHSLRGADLRGTNLIAANLSGAVLEQANFEGAHLHEAGFPGANLRNANLRNAKLRYFTRTMRTCAAPACKRLIFLTPACPEQTCGMLTWKVPKSYPQTLQTPCCTARTYDASALLRRFGRGRGMTEQRDGRCCLTPNALAQYAKRCNSRTARKRRCRYD
jgi:hypothetical protein